MIRQCLMCLLVVVSAPVFAAPPLSDAERENLADGTTDNDADLDEVSGLYVLLRNAADWQNDDFSGDAGAKVAPLPDYDYIRQNPAEARGNVYLIEGWLALHDRYPTKDNHKRDALMRGGDPAWGDQVTRWTIATAEDDPTSTIIVLFNDPRGQLDDPGKEARVRVAARFYKLWTIKDVNGKPFTYPVFVGGASEVADDASGVGAATSHWQTALIAVSAVAGGFFFFRLMMRRMNEGKGQRTAELIAARRRKREESEAGAEEDDEPIDDLPDDPVAALDVLRERHGTD